MLCRDYLIGIDGIAYDVRFAPVNIFHVLLNLNEDLAWIRNNTADR